MTNAILGIKIDSLSFREAVEKANLMVADRRNSYIVTVNPEIIMAAQKDHDFGEIINQAAFNVPDGFGLMLAGKFLKQPFQERITGVDFSWALFKLAEEKGYSIFLLGGKPGVAGQAAQKIKLVHPNLIIKGFHAGSPEDPETLDIIRNTHPDILLVAFGAPKQEKFIYHLQKEVPVPLAVGVGGTFDYIAGIALYAPKWIRKIGLEWLYRLFTQPKRINRIITATIRFPWAVLKAKFSHQA